MKRLIFLLAAARAIAITTVAAPLERKDVEATPVLVAHVDADALRSTAVGKAILANEDVQTKLGAVQAAFNFDFRTQLHGFTVYATKDPVEDAVLIIYADFQPERLIALAKVFPGFQTETNEGRTLYSWMDEHKSNEPRIFASIVGHRLIFGKSEPALKNALNVIDGKADSLGSGGGALLEGASGELVVAQAMVKKLNVEGDNPGAAIFQASKSVRLKVGELGDNVDVRVRLDAKDEDSANQVSAMINGVLALLKFQKDNPDLIRVANGVNVKQDGVAVDLTASTPSTDLIKLLQKGAEEAKEKRERHAQDTNAPAKDQ